MAPGSPVKSCSSSNARESGASPVANHNTDHKAVAETGQTENKNPGNDTVEKTYTVEEADLWEHYKPDIGKLRAQAGIDDPAELIPALLEFVSAMRHMDAEAVASGTIPPWGDGDLARDLFSWLVAHYGIVEQNLDERQPGIRDDPEKMAASRAAFNRLVDVMFPGKKWQN